MAEVLVEQRADVDHQSACLYETHRTRIYRFCLARLRSREEAEDAVQSTFLRAHGALRRGVVPRAESAWLFKIAQNVCSTRAVAASRRVRLEHAADLEQVHERVPAAQRQHDELIGLGDALEKMPANLRRPFLLREWQGLSYAEIADELGVSQSAVETLIFRARRHLAGALDVPTSRLRRALKALNFGPFLEALRPLLAGGGAKVAAAAAVATVGVVGVTAIPESGRPARTQSDALAGVQTSSGIVRSPAALVAASIQPASAVRGSRVSAIFAPVQSTSAPINRSAPSGAPWWSAPPPPVSRPGVVGTTISSGPAPPAEQTPSGTAPTGSAPAAPPAAPSPSGSSSDPPTVTVPNLPVTPPSGTSGGLPEVPVPPLPSLPAVPPVPAVPSPSLPDPPSIPEPPSVTVPPIPTPSVPPIPEPPPLPEIDPPPPPPILPEPPPLPPLPPLP